MERDLLRKILLLRMEKHIPGGSYLGLNSPNVHISSAIIRK